MTTWIIKSETDDPDRALASVEDQRAKGYTAWIEDENGTAVDEQSLKMNGRVAIKRPFLSGSPGRLLLWHPLLPVSLFFTWLAYGLTRSNAKGRASRCPICKGRVTHSTKNKSVPLIGGLWFGSSLSPPSL
jgi:hypothetical protein